MQIGIREEVMVETENDVKDRTNFLINQMLDYAFRAVALAKEKQTNIESIIYVDKDGNDSVTYAYDYKTIQMTSSTSFDKLGKDYLGDPSMGAIIAYYNKIQNEHEVEAGAVIKIPVLEKTSSNQRNKIYAVPDMQDNYGRDIELTDNGGFSVANGDFGIVEGAKNLAQALGNRFATSSEKRIRLGVYGIRSSIGDPIAIDSYLQSSIEQTVYEDPRINRVDEIDFKGKGDALYITVTYTDINSNQDVFRRKI